MGLGWFGRTGCPVAYIWQSACGLVGGFVPVVWVPVGTLTLEGNLGVVF